jgi:hypothetical protein
LRPLAPRPASTLRFTAEGSLSVTAGGNLVSGPPPVPEQAQRQHQGPIGLPGADPEVLRRGGVLHQFEPGGGAVRARAITGKRVAGTPASEISVPSGAEATTGGASAGITTAADAMPRSGSRPTNTTARKTRKQPMGQGCHRRPGAGKRQP